MPVISRFKTKDVFYIILSPTETKYRYNGGTIKEYIVNTNPVIKSNPN